MQTGRTTKKDSSGLSVITNIIKSYERFLHFTSHLAFSHIDNDRCNVLFCGPKVTE